ncbi:hypothetical protein CPB85DRAFT_1216320 [Mucidula mucida]|nr:hypothetical protein CPB85DRAFT_1220832 [Mucidula mucida]KAF8916736.1 hypothetical protein CPB85DRAFT_1216320 [Mucidula mucida]
MRVSPEARVRGSAPPTYLQLECSYNVLRSDPSASTLTPVSAADNDAKPSSDGSEGSDGEDDIGSKKHLCTTCNKRFNRPSSLRIHINTHTGATPFRCPFPGCGREFNVNSNMRRHYRNHSTSGSTGQSEEDAVPPPPSTSSPAPYPTSRRDRASRHVQHYSSSTPPASPQSPSSSSRSFHEPYKSRVFDHQPPRPRTRESDLRTRMP